MPTKAEQEELMDTNNCTWEWIARNGVNGYKVTSKKNGNFIFLPAAGSLFSSYLGNAGSDGNYCSSSLGMYLSYYARDLYFGSTFDGGVFWHESDRCYGHSVRAVCE